MKTLWLLLDNRMGSVGQAKGVAMQLENDFNIIEKNIEYNIFAKLPNAIKGASLLGLKKQSKKDIRTNFPDLVISASRRTAPIARWIKKQSKNTKIIQLLHPGNTGLNDFNLIFVPHHDKDRRKPNPNIIYMFGSPHRLSKEKLEQAKNDWQKEFNNLPKPLTAVLIGGGKKFDHKNTKQFCNELKSLKEKIGGSLLITTSKRTPYYAAKTIIKELSNYPSHQYIWGQNNNQENPFFGYIACSDNVVVTGDSVSMISEACGTSKPVFMYLGKNWLKEKHKRFAYSLSENNYAKILSDKDIKNFTPKNTLNTAEYVASKIKELF